MTTYSTSIPALVNVDPIRVHYRLSDTTLDRDALERNLLNTVSIEAEATISLPTDMAPGRVFEKVFQSTRAYNGHKQSVEALMFCKDSIARQLADLKVELADNHMVLVFIGGEPTITRTPTTWKELGQ